MVRRAILSTPNYLEDNHDPDRMSRTIPFRYEDELCATLLQAMGGLFSNGRWKPGEAQVFERRPVGSVIPDLIWIRRSLRVKTLRTAAISGLDAAIIDAIAASPRHTDTSLSAALFTSEDRLRRRTDSLVRKRLLGRAEGGEYRLATSTGHQVASIVAVEAKLTRWRDAIDQAMTYLAFADESYVALPDSLAGASSIRGALSQLPLGLISVGRMDSTILRKARRLTPRTPDRFWLLARTTGLPTLHRECA